MNGWEKTQMPELTELAFPGMESNEMTLRDYFAAKAMQGFLANGAYGRTSEPRPDNLALYSYEQADAMLKAREQ